MILKNNLFREFLIFEVGVEVGVIFLILKTVLKDMIQLLTIKVFVPFCTYLNMRFFR